MDSQILYLVIGVLVGAIAIYFFVKKNSNSADNTCVQDQPSFHPSTKGGFLR